MIVILHSVLFFQSNQGLEFAKIPFTSHETALAASKDIKHSGSRWIADHPNFDPLQDWRDTKGKVNSLTDYGNAPFGYFGTDKYSLLVVDMKETQDPKDYRVWFWENIDNLGSVRAVQILLNTATPHKRQFFI